MTIFVNTYYPTSPSPLSCSSKFNLMSGLHAFSCPVWWATISIFCCTNTNQQYAQHCFLLWTQKVREKMIDQASLISGGKGGRFHAILFSEIKYSPCHWWSWRVIMIQRLKIQFDFCLCLSVEFLHKFCVH